MQASARARLRQRARMTTKPRLQKTSFTVGTAERVRLSDIRRLSISVFLCAKLIWGFCILYIFAYLRPQIVHVENGLFYLSIPTISL